MIPSRVSDIEGPWIDPEFPSGLVERCKEFWNTPAGRLPNGILAMFIRQGFGLAVVVPEAKRRLFPRFIEDGSELAENELSEALNDLERA